MSKPPPRSGTRPRPAAQGCGPLLGQQSPGALQGQQAGPVFTGMLDAWGPLTIIRLHLCFTSSSEFVMFHNRKS